MDYGDQYWGEFTIKRNPRRKSTKLRDSQRQKMYNWQWQAVTPKDPKLTARMTLAECSALVKKIFESHGLRCPDIKYVRSRARKSAHYWHENPRTGRPEILFTEAGLTLNTTLHEVAHGLAYKYAKTPEAGHGPTFIRCYIDLLVKYAKQNVTELRQSAKAYRLKVAPQPDYEVKPYTHGTIPKVAPAIAATKTEKYRTKKMIVNGSEWTWKIPVG